MATKEPGVWASGDRRPRACPRCKERSLWGAPVGGDFKFNKTTNDTERGFRCTRCQYHEYRPNWGVY